MMEKDVKNKCFKCGGEFTRRDSLRRHLKTHDRPKLICCGKTFKRGDFYKAHKVKYHGPDILVLSPSKKQCRVSVNQGASTSRDIVNQVVTSVLGKVNNNVQNSEISRLQSVIGFNFTPAVQEMKSGNDDLDVYTRAPIVSHTSLELRKPYKVVSYNRDEDNVVLRSENFSIYLPKRFAKKPIPRNLTRYFSIDIEQSIHRSRTMTSPTPVMSFFN